MSRSNFGRRLAELEAVASKAETAAVASRDRLVPSCFGKNQLQIQTEFLQNLLRHPKTANLPPAIRERIDRLILRPDPDDMDRFFNSPRPPIGVLQ